MALLLQFSDLRFPGFELSQSYQFLCLSGSAVLHPYFWDVFKVRTASVHKQKTSNSGETRKHIFWQIVINNQRPKQKVQTNRIEMESLIDAGTDVKIISPSSPAVVAHAFKPSTWEAETGGFLGARPAWSTE